MDAPLSPAAPTNYGAVQRVLSPEDSFSKRADGSRRSLVAHSLLHRQRDSEADRIPETESVRVRWAIRASLIINVVRDEGDPGRWVVEFVVRLSRLFCCGILDPGRGQDLRDSRQ